MDRFVAINGSIANPGTLAAPWPLKEVLDDPTGKYAKPGDTIYLRGGTYRWPDRSLTSPGWVVHLIGTPEAPIWIRPYQQERVTLDGGMTNKVKAICRHLRVVGLEVMVAEWATHRTTTQAGSHPTDLPCGGGFNFTAGHDVKLINNVVHLNRQGISFWENVDGNSELYGNVIYDNGWTGAGADHGHGIYTQNSTASDKLIRHNFLFANYGENLQAYGSATALVERYRHEQNIAFWSPLNSRGGDVIYGGLNNASNNDLRLLGNVDYRAKLMLGYAGHGGRRDIATGNFCWKCDLQIDPSLTAPTVSNNFEWKPGKPAPVGGVMPTIPFVWLFPNQYDADRANVAIFNFLAAATVKVPVDPWLQDGDAFALQRAEDFYGPPLVEGLYDGSGFINVPMNGGDFFAGVLMADRNACAAIIEERDALQIKLVELTGQLNDSRDDRDRLTVEAANLRTELAELQLTQNVAQNDLAAIRGITEKWSN